ncbi:DNA N-6-adenine-methyltransferase, partial [Dulcicalothrix desertica]
SDNWYTPPYIVELVVQVLGEIDLDPCAEVGKKIPAREHYTIDFDGLSKQWHGRVFLNPPYSCPGK